MWKLNSQLMFMSWKILPLSQYETGDGEASTWHSSWTSDPKGAPRSWDGAFTVGWTDQEKWIWWKFIEIIEKFTYNEHLIRLVCWRLEGRHFERYISKDPFVVVQVFEDEANFRYKIRLKMDEKCRNKMRRVLEIK